MPSELDLLTIDQLKEKLSDWRWRMNNLYFITDKKGRKVRFKMNEQQMHFFSNMHYRNLILKARQLGFTTFKMIFMLDACLFNDNTKAAVITHSQHDSIRLFREKIQFAYNELPTSIKKMMPAKIGRAGEYVFANDSSISVGTSFRGGTLTYLHVSEFGKICSRYPEKAKEIVTGAFEAVPKDSVITIESTAEGKSGYFFDYCQEAQNRKKKGVKIGQMDWELFFYPWFETDEYSLDQDAHIPERLLDYFDTLEKKYAIRLSNGQLQWYTSKESTLGTDIKREYPATPDEAFEQSIEGAYYKRQIDKIYSDGRYTNVPFEPSGVVHTVWDLGISDMTSIWFVQQIGREWRVINYYENSGEGLAFYKKKLDQLSEKHGYNYGTHVAPHDIEHRELGTGLSRIEQAQKLGIRFEVAPKLSIADGIEAVRAILGICWFDEKKTEEGFKGLQSYRKEWDDKAGVWKSRPLHDDASHPSDAFRYFAVSINLLRETMNNMFNQSSSVVVEDAEGWE